MERISVCFSNDQNQIELLYVAIKSLVHEFEAGGRYEEYALDIYVIAIDLSDEMKKIISLCAVSSVAVTRVIFHDYELQGRYPLSRFKSAEIVTLVFFVSEFFPKLERLIYLDSDMLVTGDITELWEANLRDRWLGVVDKVYDPSRKARRLIRPLSPLTTPVNSGTVLLDLCKMRKEGISSQLDAFVAKHQRWLRMPDQDAFEYVAFDRLRLEHKWNWRGVARISEIYWSGPSKNAVGEYEEILPSLVHFQWPIRPNRYRLRNQWFDEWNQYYNGLGLAPLKKQAYGLLIFVRISVGTHRLGSAKTMRLYFRFAWHTLLSLPKYIYYRLV